MLTVKRAPKDLIEKARGLNGLMILFARFWLGWKYPYQNQCFGDCAVEIQYEFFPTGAALW